MTAPALTARPAVQRFRRGVVVHAVAAQPVTLHQDSPVLCPLTLAPGEPLCCTLAPLEPPEPGLFPEPVTCQRCLAVAAREGITMDDAP